MVTLSLHFYKLTLCQVSLNTCPTCLLHASHQAGYGRNPFEIYRTICLISHRRERLSWLRCRSTSTGTLFGEIICGLVCNGDCIGRPFLGIPTFYYILKATSDIVAGCRFLVQRNCGQGKHQVPLMLSAEDLTAACRRFCAKIWVFRPHPLPHTCLIPLAVRSMERTKNGFPGHGVRKDSTRGKSIRLRFTLKVQNYVSGLCIRKGHGFCP